MKGPVLLGAALALAVPASVTAVQTPPGRYRVDWNQAPFAEPMWLVQCTGPCPDDGLALVANPGGFPAGSLRVLGGPYRHGAELERDRTRLVATGLPARPLRVDVRDQAGRPIDGVLLGDPGELRRLAAAELRRMAPADARHEAPRPRSAMTSTMCRFSQGPQAGRTIDFSGRPGVSGIAVGSRCADADGSMGVVVASAAAPR